MAKVKSSQKKVSLSELNNHTTTNKRQALKDLSKLNFDELMYKNPAQRRFYKTISSKDITFGIGPAGSWTCIIWPACAPAGTWTVNVPGWTTGCICIACPGGNQSRK